MVKHIQGLWSILSGLCEPSAQWPREIFTVWAQVRIGCWALLFFAIFLFLTKSDKPDFRRWSYSQDYRQACEHSYLAATEEKTTPDTFRIAIIGASETLDYLRFNNSIGMSMVRQAPKITSSRTDVIEATWPAVSRRWKIQKIGEALEFNADIIIVSSMLGDYISPIQQGDTLEEAPGIRSVLLMARMPCDLLDRLFSTLVRDYRGNLGALFRGKAAAEAAFAPVVMPETIKRETAEEDPGKPAPSMHESYSSRVAQEVAKIRREISIHPCEACAASIDPNVTIDILTTMARPAMLEGVPVIFVVAPMNGRNRLRGHEVHYEWILDQIADGMNIPGIILFNARARNVVEEEAFQDIAHLKDFDSLARALLELMVEKGYLKPQVAGAGELPSSTDTPEGSETASG